MLGQVTTVGHNIAPQSDIAVFNMLGYDFRDEAYVGRCYRADWIGVDLRDGDLAVRGNFAAIDDNGKILDRRAGRDISEREANAICESLSSKVRFSDPDISVVIKPTTGHRLVIRFRHNNLKLSDNIGNTDPAYDKISGIGVARISSFQDKIEASMPRDDLDTSKISAQLINNFSDQVISILKNHPVNEEREYAGKKAYKLCSSPRCWKQDSETRTYWNEIRNESIRCG